MIKHKMYIFPRARKDKSVLKTYSSKFLNLFMKKGFKTKTIKIFLSLFVLHKQRLKGFFYFFNGKHKKHKKKYIKKKRLKKIVVEKPKFVYRFDKFYRYRSLRGNFFGRKKFRFKKKKK